VNTANQSKSLHQLYVIKIFSTRFNKEFITQLLCIPLIVIGLAALFSIPVAYVKPEWFRMASRRDAVLGAVLVAAYYLGTIVVVFC